MKDFHLHDAVYLISGGGTGLGLGIAKQMVGAGAAVVLIGRREEPLKRAAEKLGSACAYTVADVTSESGVRQAVEFSVERHGRLDGVVNNAGNHLKKPLASTGLQEFYSVLDVHVAGSFLLTKQALPYLEQSPNGHILFISSMAYFMGMENVVAYTAAKSAVAGMTRQLAVELSTGGVRVNAIAPGWISSEMLEAALAKDKTRKEKILSRIAMHSFGSPEDIGNAAVYLSSSAARYVTGVVLPVDGGAVASL